MFDASQKSTGTRYTTTVALLVAAFIFIPAVLLISRPVGYVPMSLAIACSVACVAMAWVKWKRSSQLTITSIVAQKAAGK